MSVPQVENEELAGPIAFWSMLVNHIAEAVRRVAQTAAFLPPDNVRISALEALELLLTGAGGARECRGSRPRRGE